MKKMLLCMAVFVLAFCIARPACAEKRFLNTGTGSINKN